MSNIMLRPGRPTDRGFIFSTWLKGLLYGCPQYKGVDQAAFYENMGSELEDLVAQPYLKITVACLAEDEDVVLGYAVTSQDALHWVFVKKAWRSQGIARSLLGRPFKTFSARTAAGDALAAKKGLVYNPWAF